MLSHEAQVGQVVGTSLLRYRVVSASPSAAYGKLVGAWRGPVIGWVDIVSDLQEQLFCSGQWEVVA